MVAHQCEGLQVELDAACGGAFANHDVDLVVFECGVEDFFHHGREAVDFVNKQHVVCFQIGEQRGQVFGFFKHGAAGLTQINAKFLRDDVR